MSRVSMLRTDPFTEHSSTLEHTYYHSDGNGNITALLNANQFMVGRYLFDPFGNALSASGPKAGVNRYRFSSKEWHAQSGLVYYGYRWYVPEVQRWPNRDPPLRKKAESISMPMLETTPSRSLIRSGWKRMRPALISATRIWKIVTVPPTLLSLDWAEEQSALVCKA